MSYMDEKRLNHILKHFIEFDDINFEASTNYIDLYSNVDEKISMYFIYFHQNLNNLLQFMNSRGPKSHYTANESRFLLSLIGQIKEFQQTLNNTKYKFLIDEEYLKWMNYCELFLETSGGSTIPSDYERVSLKRFDPIFFLDNNSLVSENISFTFKIRPVGAGAYAKVYSFCEPNTGKKFAIKRLNKDIVGKELIRFKLEFEKMNKINNPYILRAYSYNENDNSYIMEYCDFTLKEYIEKNNNIEYMDVTFRRKIAMQFLNAINYLHSKGLLHRDVSLNNILIKEYDDNFVVVKLSDFGLIKDKDLGLTSTDSDIRGTIIDDTLTSFKDYNIKNEIYAIGVVLWFIFTGKKSLSTLTNEGIGYIVNKCIDRDHSKRYNDVNEIINDVVSHSKKNTVNDMSKEKKKKIMDYKPNSNIINGLNENSFSFLKAMVEDTKSNQMFYIKTLSGEKFQTSDGIFELDLEECSPREKVLWKDSFNTLIEKGLVRTIGSKSDIFEVTKIGYEIYDSTIKILKKIIMSI